MAKIQKFSKSAPPTKQGSKPAPKNTPRERKIGDIRVQDNIEKQCIMVFFGSFPSETVRNALKKNGYRWDPGNKCWTHSRSDHHYNNFEKMIPVSA